jgi:hypothetical protein
MPSSSRKTHSKGVSGSDLALTALPLTSKLTLIENLQLKKGVRAQVFDTPAQISASPARLHSGLRKENEVFSF